MPTDQVLFAALAAVLTVQLAVVALARRRGTPGESDEPARTEDGSVVCPECRTENEPDYRYCRSCVSELPGTGPTAPIPSSPSGRRTM